MPVMDVGVVRMGMKQRLVPVRMAMRLAGRVVRTVGVLVMLFVGVQMVMLHWLVLVLVFVALGQV